MADDQGTGGGGGRRRAGARAVRRGGGGSADPQAAVRAAFEAAGIDMEALRKVFGSLPADVFSVPQDPQASRQAAMATGSLVTLHREGLEKAIERDPEKAPEAMARWESAYRVCSEALMWFAMQGTKPAPEEQAGADVGELAS